MTGDADRDVGGPYVHPSHPDYAFHKWLWEQSHAPRTSGIDPKVLSGILFIGFAYVVISTLKN